MTARFIAMEGIDGAGLSSQTALLASWLAQRGERVIICETPSHSMVGGLIKGRLAKEWSPSKLCTRFLFAADTCNLHDSVIKPALKDNKFVICERYILSALSWGSVDFDREWLKTVYRELTPPEITFYLKIPPKLAIQRLGQDGMMMKFFEQETHLKQVSDNFDELANAHPNIHIIDGTKSISEVHKDIVNILQKKFSH